MKANLKEINLKISKYGNEGGNSECKNSEL